MNHTLHGEEATAALGRAFARALAPGDVVLLEGPVGAGKSTFARAVLRGLGLPEDEPAPSPTFALVLDYPTDPPVLHGDFYRLARDEDVHVLGLDEQLEGAVGLFEWAEARRAALPHVDLVLRFDRPTDHARILTVAPSGARGDTLAAAIAAALR